LVQAFAGAVALLILISLLDAPSGRVILEAAACLLDGAALFAMTRVYLLRTVPVWNSPATLLEFAGSAFTKPTGGSACKCKRTMRCAPRNDRRPFTQEDAYSKGALLGGVPS
jgi:DMSO reductase anchor subunit